MYTIVHKTRTAEISFEESSYILIKLLPGSVIDEADALDNLLVIKNLSKGEKQLKLIDVRGKIILTDKAKEVSKNNVSQKNTIARAYLVDSFLNIVLRSFFESFNQSEIPQKFFTKKEDAIKWLMEFKK